jgi:transposase
MINQNRGVLGLFPPEDKITLVSIACQEPSQWGLIGQTHWTISTLQYVIKKERIIPQISTTTIQRFLCEMDLKPHRMEYYLFCKDVDLLEKSKKICKLYLNPPKNRILLSYDERSGTQAIERPDSRPMIQGRVARQDFGYLRHGTTDVLGIFEVETGKVFCKCYNRHSQDEFLDFMEHVIKRYPGKNITIIMDNLKTHSTKKVMEWLHAHRNVKFVFTPKHASWLNQIELWFRELNQKCLKRLSVKSVDELQKVILSWIKTYNKIFAHPYNWKSNGVLTHAA